MKVVLFATALTMMSATAAIACGDDGGPFSSHSLSSSMSASGAYAHSGAVSTSSNGGGAAVAVANASAQSSAQASALVNVQNSNVATSAASRRCNKKSCLPLVTPGMIFRSMGESW